MDQAVQHRQADTGCAATRCCRLMRPIAQPHGDLCDCGQSHNLTKTSATAANRTSSLEDPCDCRHAEEPVPNLSVLSDLVKDLLVGFEILGGLERAAISVQLEPV